MQHKQPQPGKIWVTALMAQAQLAVAAVCFGASKKRSPQQAGLLQVCCLHSLSAAPFPRAIGGDETTRNGNRLIFPIHSPGNRHNGGGLANCRSRTSDPPDKGTWRDEIYSQMLRVRSARHVFALSAFNFPLSSTFPKNYTSAYRGSALSGSKRSRRSSGRGSDRGRRASPACKASGR